MKPSHRWRFPRPYGPRKFRFDDGPQEATFGELLAFVMFFLVAFVLIRYFFGSLMYDSLFWWNWPHGFWH